MSEKNNKNTNRFLKVLLVLFIAFLCLYSISQNGYTEKLNENKTLYTEEQIKKFENDISNGKEIDIEEYLSVNTTDYRNASSRFGVKLSNTIQNGAKKSIDVLLGFFSYLFE